MHLARCGPTNRPNVLTYGNFLPLAANWHDAENTLGVKKMQRPSNRQVEKHYFEQFRHAYEIPQGEVFYTDKPDVIVRGQQALGIEITNLYIAPGEKPTSEQVQRHWREQVLQLAQAIFIRSGGKKIEISADFHPEKAILQIQPVAQALAELVHRIQDFPTGQVSYSLFEHIEPLRFVYFNNYEYADAKWRLVQSFSISNLSTARLREVVAEKSEKLSTYQPCDQYWLLVVVDFMDLAQDQHLQWPSGETLGRTPYEKVLLFKPQFNQVREVPRHLDCVSRVE